MSPAVAPEVATGALPAPLRVTVLDTFAVHEGDRCVPLPRSGQRLVGYLALQRRPVPREEAASALWEQTRDRQAFASLRATLTRLPRLQGGPLVHSRERELSLPPGTEVDLWQARAWMDRASRPPQDGGALESAAQEACSPLDAADTGLLEGDLLPAWADDWVIAERERHRQLRLHALERLCRLHREAGRYDQAMRAALAAVAGEPLRESAHRHLIELHLCEGNAAEALRQYDLYRRLLRTELGLAPSPAIRALVAGLLGRPVDAARGRAAGAS